MNILKKIAAIIALASTVAAPAFAGVIQTVSNPNAVDLYYGAGAELNRITFASGTNNVSSLSTIVTTVDQGWGGQCDCNQVYVALVDANNIGVWGEHVAGSTHDWNTYNFDLASDPIGFENLNKALAAMDYSNGGSAAMVMYAANIGWQGWELHVNGAEMSIESSQVPEPTSIALIGLGLAGFAAARRKSSKR
jgi:hypothetical protein